MGKKNLGSNKNFRSEKKCGSKKILHPKKILVQRNFESTELWVQKLCQPGQQNDKLYAVYNANLAKICQQNQQETRIPEPASKPILDSEKTIQAGQPHPPPPRGTRGLCSRIVNFCRTEAGLTSKWGRILPAVYWWHQNPSSYVIGRRATSRDVA